MATQQWASSDIPHQRGNVAVVTGGNSGIGYEAALALAGKGAHVILAARSAEKAQASAEAIRRAHPGAAVEVMALDLSDLASVRGFAAAFQQRFAALPLLINNAGVMALPYRRTADGFEMQFGTNHLGHFALTGLLLPAILAAPRARVVTVSSGLHIGGAIDFANLDGAKSYSRLGAYNQSKLANLLFAYELQRRFAATNASAISVGCHPGFAATNLQAAGSRMDGSRFGEAFSEVSNRLFAQSAAMGALPTLYAATAPDVNGCDYIGPVGFLGMRGAPVKAKSSGRSYDAQLAARLWQVSEDLTGVRYTALGAPLHANMR
ncbi:MAG: SDR family NAD(P)-dependent oxidoreductase [Chloroflexales bacterium]|nr:SDR family NAD(P)-dependent oxidoreductase [Chloroflexales bacterium]